MSLFPPPLPVSGQEIWLRPTGRWKRTWEEVYDSGWTVTAVTTFEHDGVWWLVFEGSVDLEVVSLEAHEWRPA